MAVGVRYKEGHGFFSSIWYAISYLMYVWQATPEEIAILRCQNPKLSSKKALEMACKEVSQNEADAFFENMTEFPGEKILRYTPDAEISIKNINNLKEFYREEFRWNKMGYSDEEKARRRIVINFFDGAKKNDDEHLKEEIVYEVNIASDIKAMVHDKLYGLYLVEFDYPDKSPYDRFYFHTKTLTNLATKLSGCHAMQEVMKKTVVARSKIAEQKMKEAETKAKEERMARDPDFAIKMRYERLRKENDRITQQIMWAREIPHVNCQLNAMKRFLAEYDDLALRNAPTRNTAPRNTTPANTSANNVRRVHLDDDINEVIRQEIEETQRRNVSNRQVTALDEENVAVEENDSFGSSRNLTMVGNSNGSSRPKRNRRVDIDHVRAAMGQSDDVDDDLSEDLF